MPVPLGPANYLQSYRWKVDPNKMISGGIVYVHDQHPENEIYLYDDGRVEHIVRGTKIASIDKRKIQNYLAGFHKY